MCDALVLALVQLNPTVGAVEANGARVRAAREIRADLLVCSELVISGYPPEDLVYRVSFLDRVRAEVESLAAETADDGPAVLVGAPWREGDCCYNAAILLDGGRIAAVRYKYHLPNHGVFDEARVFTPAASATPIPFRGMRLGVLICEDMWYPDVSAHLTSAGADILVVINSSPFDVCKPNLRRLHAEARVLETTKPLIYVNQVGGQDELVFDGVSFVLSKDCMQLVRAPAWQESVVLTTWNSTPTGHWICHTTNVTPPPTQEENIYQAMMIGLRDYVVKNGFASVLLGLSGGIDSALSAAVAVDALGADRVHGIMLPSPYTARESLDDAAAVACYLGIQLDVIPIEPAMQAFSAMLDPWLAKRPPDITEENIQARVRGLTLMALSNASGGMVLSTGNKSEMSVGYATLYGDMCGGYAVLKDIYKTTVFTIAHWRNRQRPSGSLGPSGPVMPERVITKPPTAELRLNQTDQDTLPPYADLDAILASFIEDESSVHEVVARGFNMAAVQRIWQMLNLAEYKRRQAPPGVKISRRAFGRERRYPITNAYRN
ncbi:NAD synthetase / Glutamine amidotransferase chain of NAD synthetase [invertebrate metagenome]|uniref:NAD(+) synthase (glutamine-hydrolyzing) n=1 Tax=invertebrate metagenome TaxID=1711999 RepID=A0A484H710_9ZZZZ